MNYAYALTFGGKYPIGFQLAEVSLRHLDFFALAHPAVYLDPPSHSEAFLSHRHVFASQPSSFQDLSQYS